MSRMKLWVDDIRSAPDPGWTVARTATAAIRIISMFGPSMDEISLDHDISHQVGMGELSRPYPCEETFESVAHYIAMYWCLERYPGSPHVPLVTIHSANPVGAENMKKIMDGTVNVVVKPMGAANRLEMEV